MDKTKAKHVLELITGMRNELAKESPCPEYVQEKVDNLKKLGIKAFGNKGKSWQNKGCITNLDAVKGKCTPRLSFNYCDIGNIGCEKCLQALKDLAGGGEVKSSFKVFLKLSQWSANKHSLSTSNNGNQFWSSEHTVEELQAVKAAIADYLHELEREKVS